MLVDKDHPPTYIPDYADHYERGLDPWHRDAFPDEFKNRAPNQEETRSGGWFLVDWCGNQIGWVPDGVEFDKESPVDHRVLVV